MEAKRVARVRFLGAMGCVTGSATLLEFNTGEFVLRYLIDVGLVQNDPVQTLDAEIKKLATSVNVVFITHAHADHIGRIPLLLESGFSGQFYFTKATAAISKVMLEDQLKIQGYSKEKVQEILQLFESRWFLIDKDGGFLFSKTYIALSADIQFTALRTSHILGSCSYVFRWTENDYEEGWPNEKKKWMYLYATGDLGPTSRGASPGCLFKNVQFPFSEGADKFIIMESTYGNRRRDKQYSLHQNRLKRLEEIVNDAIDTESMLVIPAFSLDRAQQILIDLKFLLESNRIHDLPIFNNTYRLVKKSKLSNETLAFVFDIAEKNGRPVSEVASWLSQKELNARLDGLHTSIGNSPSCDYSMARVKWQAFCNLWRNHMQAEFSFSDADIEYQSLVPEFQRALVDLDNEYPMKEMKKAKQVPITLHSPLMGAINQVYRDHCADTLSVKKEVKTKYLSDDFLELFQLMKDEDVIWNKLGTLLPDCPKDLQLPFKRREQGFPTSIVLTSSGMVDKGNVLTILKDVLIDEQAIILLTGYQSPDSNGYLLQHLGEFTGDDAYNKRVIMNDGKSLRLADIRCRIIDIGPYYSGHADQSQLVDYATMPTRENNRTVFLLHGSEDARNALKDAIEQKSSGRRIVLPTDTRQWYRLATGGKVELDSLEAVALDACECDGAKMLKLSQSGITVQKSDDGILLNFSLHLDNQNASEILTLLAGLLNKENE